MHKMSTMNALYCKAYICLKSLYHQPHLFLHLYDSSTKATVENSMKLKIYLRIVLKANIIINL